MKKYFYKSLTKEYECYIVEETQNYLYQKVLIVWLDEDASGEVTQVGEMMGYKNLTDAKSFINQEYGPVKRITEDELGV